MHAAESPDLAQRMLEKLYHVMKEGGFLFIKYKANMHLPAITGLFRVTEPEKLSA
ncbi:MAG: hypothetical protein ACOCXH_09565 [Cyclobacteriaceae bacterium]